MDPVLGMAILAVFVLAIIGIIMYLLQHQKHKVHAGLPKSSPAQRKSSPKKQPSQPQQELPPQEPIPQSEVQEVRHFHKIENMKENARNKIFGSFTSVDAMKKSRQKGKQAAMDSHNYKIRHVHKIKAKTEQQKQQEHAQHKENISTIKGISHASPVSRMRKLFKKPDEKFLKKIIKEEEKEESMGEDSNSMKKLAGMSNEKSKAVTRLRFLRRTKS